MKYIEVPAIYLPASTYEVDQQSSRVAKLEEELVEIAEVGTSTQRHKYKYKVRYNRASR